MVEFAEVYEEFSAKKEILKAQNQNLNGVPPSETFKLSRK